MQLERRQCAGWTKNPTGFSTHSPVVEIQLQKWSSSKFFHQYIHHFHLFAPFLHG